MQGLKIIVMAGVLTFAVGTAVAASTTPATKNDDKKSEAEALARELADKESQIVQDRLASIAEDDYTFEMARRKLQNEVELEKMRSEIRKLRGEDKARPAPAPVSAATEPKEPIQSAAAIVMPRVVLQADIGGSQRVAVTNGDTLRYVRAGEVFSMGGHDFKLSGDKKSVVLIGAQ